MNNVYHCQQLQAVGCSNKLRERTRCGDSGILRLSVNKEIYKFLLALICEMVLELLSHTFPAHFPHRHLVLQFVSLDSGLSLLCYFVTVIKVL